MNHCKIENMFGPKTSKPKVLSVRKRESSRLNEVFLPPKPNKLLSYLSNGDRFIPRRRKVYNEDQNKQYYYEEELFDILAPELPNNYWRTPMMKLVMDDVFDIKKRRILNFNNFNVNDGISSTWHQAEIILGKRNVLDWPCTPRNKPMALVDTTHDLPGFESYADLNVIDWSRTGQIAASFGSELVLWNPNSDLTAVFACEDSKAVAYSPKGNLLAVGCRKKQWAVIELWSLGPKVYIEYGHVFDKSSEDVVVIEWEYTGESLVCGTELGNIYVFTVPELKVVKKVCRHDLPIFSMKFSPNFYYLATCDIEGNIFIWEWSNWTVHCALRSQRKLRAVMSWHPWSSEDLAISEDMPASIVLLHVPSKKIVAYYQRRDFNCVIDYISYSKISGELVVSYSTKNNESDNFKSGMIVLSSLDRIVDHLDIQCSHVRFMKWSPDGMQLATAGTDETLVIWNFFSNKEDKDELKQELNMKSAVFKPKNIHKHLHENLGYNKLLVSMYNPPSIR